MRALADAASRPRIYSLALRMPGHGTVAGRARHTRPGRTGWPPCAMGARHVQEHASPDGPAHPRRLFQRRRAGAENTRLDALEERSRPAPSKLILLSPMIGASPQPGWRGDQPARRPVLREGAAGSTSCRNTTRSGTTRSLRTRGSRRRRLTRALRNSLGRVLAAAGRLADLIRRSSRSNRSWTPTVSTPARHLRAATTGLPVRRQRTGAVRRQSSVRHRRVHCRSPAPSLAAALLDGVHAAAIAASCDKRIALDTLDASSRMTVEPGHVTG